MSFVFGVLLVFSGLVMVIFPEFVYELTESWKSDAIGIPSKWFLISTRFGGVMCVLAGLAGIIITFIS